MRKLEGYKLSNIFFKEEDIMSEQERVIDILKTTNKGLDEFLEFLEDLEGGL